MLSDAELREMERLVGVRSGLPKVQARQLIAAYRELLGNKKKAPALPLHTGVWELPPPQTLDEFIASLPTEEQEAIGEQARKLVASESKRQRRKKNEVENS